MNEIIARLGAWGCDIKGALDRMCDDEEFYIECLHTVAQDPNFDILKTRLETGDTKGAFDAAHTLKGVLANVGLTPMYNKVVEIVEPLRAGKADPMSLQITQLFDMKRHLEDIISDHGSEA